MKLADMQKEIDRARAIGLERVMLVFPRPWKAPPRFPRRELACVNTDGRAVCWVNLDRLEKWVRSMMPAEPAPDPEAVYQDLGGEG